MFRPRSPKYTEVRIHNSMAKGFIVKNIFVETAALVSKGGGTGGAGGAIAPPLFTDHFKNYILFDYSDRKLLLTFLTQKQV